MSFPSSPCAAPARASRLPGGLVFISLLILFLAGHVVSAKSQKKSGLASLVPKNEWMSDSKAAFLLGRLLSESGKSRDESEHWFRRALAGPEPLAEARLELARIHVAAKDWHAAKAELEAARRDGLNDIRVRHLAAQIDLWQGNHVQAAAELQSLARENPASGSLWLELGQAWQWSGKYASAVQALNEGIQKASDRKSLLREARADAFVSLGRYSAALEEYRALASDTAEVPIGRMPAINRKLALTCRYSDNLAEAEDRLRHIWKKDPGDREVAVALVNVLARLDRPEESLPIMRSLLAAHPQDMKLLFLAADVDLALGHCIDARDELRKAFDAGSEADDIDEFKVTWANRLIQMGDFRTAIGLLQSITPRSGSWLRARLELGQALTSVERFAEAEQVYCLILRKDPACAGALVGMARMTFKAKRFDEAKNWCDKTIATGPDDKEARFILASLLALENTAGDASRQIEILLADRTTPDWILKQVPLILSRFRDVDPAGRLMQKCIRRLATSPACRLEHLFWSRADRQFSYIMNTIKKTRPRDLVAAGDLFAATESASAATDLYRAALKADPELFPATIKLGQQLGSVRRFSEAMQVTAGIAEAWPEHYDLARLRARLLAWNRRFPEALAAFERLATDDASDPGPLFEAARAAAWAGWPARSRGLYQRLREKEVHEDLLQELARLGKDPGWLMEEQRRLAGLVRAGATYQVYEQFRKDIEDARPRLVSETADVLDEISLKYRAAWRIQKEACLEEKAKDLVRQGHLRGSIPVFTELMAFAPGNEEIRFDLSQVYCSLGLVERERNAYRELLRIDPWHNLVRQADRKREIDTGSRLQLSWDRSWEAGRGQLSGMLRDHWQMAGETGIAPGWRVSVAENRWEYRPEIWRGTFSARGSSLRIWGVGNEWVRGQAGLTQRQFSSNRQYPGQRPRDGEDGFIDLSFNLQDAADLAIGFDRSAEYVNDIGLRDGVHIDSRWASLNIPFTPDWHGKVRIADQKYSDDNQGRLITWETGYAFTKLPDILRLIVSGELRNTDSHSRFVFLNGDLANIIHPYWTPQGYSSRNLTLQWYKDVSRIRISRADHHYLDLRVSCGDDSNENPSRRIEGTWHWEFSDRWVLEFRGMWHDSPDWKSRTFGILMEHRF